MASGLDARVHVWNVREMKVVARLQGPANVECVAVSSDGHRVAAGFASDKAIVWDTTNSNELATLKHTAKKVSAIALSADGVRAATLDEDGGLGVFRVAGGERVASVQPVPARKVPSFGVSGDGELLVLGGDDGVVHAWDAASGSIRELVSLGKSVWSLSLATDGSDLVVASSDVSAFIDPKSGTVRRRSKGSYSLDVAADRKTYAMQRFGGVQVHSMNDDRLLFEITDWGTDVAGGVAFSRDATVLAAGGSDGRIRLRRGRPVPLLQGVDMLPIKMHAPSLEFSPDGRSLASGDMDELVMWDAAAMRVRWRSEKLPRGAGSIDFSSDGALVATAALFDGVRVWEVQTGRQHMQPQVDTDARRVQFLKGDRRVIWCGDSGRISIADVDLGSRVGTLELLPGAKAAWATAANGSVGLYGDSRWLEERLTCAVGAARLPLQVCAERLVRPSLARELLTANDAWLEP